MRRVIACNALAALLLAVTYAPFVHVHSEDAGATPFVHAHFPEIESEHGEASQHVEPGHHSLHNARWIDIFTTTQAHVVTLQAIIVSTYISLNPGETSRGFVCQAVPRAHAPPGLFSRIPRSPPA
jgi:hypothetical protein